MTNISSPSNSIFVLDSYIEYDIIFIFYLYGEKLMTLIMKDFRESNNTFIELVRIIHLIFYFYFIQGFS